MPEWRPGPLGGRRPASSLPPDVRPSEDNRPATATGGQEPQPSSCGAASSGKFPAQVEAGDQHRRQLVVELAETVAQLAADAQAAQEGRVVIVAAADDALGRRLIEAEPDLGASRFGQEYCVWARPYEVVQSWFEGAATPVFRQSLPPGGSLAHGVQVMVVAFEGVSLLHVPLGR